MVKSFVNIIFSIASTIISMLPRLIAVGLQLIMALHQGILNNIGPISQTIMSTIGQIIQLIAASLPQILQAATGIALAMSQALLDNMPVIIQAIVDIVVAMIGEIGRSAGMFIDMGIKIIFALINGIISAIPAIIDAIIDAFPQILEAIIGSLPLIVDGVIQALIKLFMLGLDFERLGKIGLAIIEGIGLGIKKGIDNLFATAATGFDKFISDVKKFFGIASPSKLLPDSVDTWWKVSA